MTIFTVITNGYDDLKSVSELNDNNEYIAFVDNVNINPKGWKLIDINELNPPLGLHGRKLQRWVKIIGGLTYLKSDSIYIDGSYIINGDLSELFKNHNKTTFKIHPVRVDYIQEVSACRYLKKDNDKILRNQLELYSNIDNGAEHEGLYETGVIYRKYDEGTIKLCEAWWDEVDKYSIRDQISLPFVLAKTGVRINSITNKQLLQYATLTPHNK